ncbi:MAG: tetratricopeptide repeat protein [Cyanophyceae cyanobacterium]
MVPFSLCMIVKNEEAALPQCLESVQNVVDEMVVLDTGSTDQTIAVAQSFGARVHTFEWDGSFASARNQALQHVQGDWVLVLDADEVLRPEVVPLMQQAMAVENNLVINLLRQEIGAVQSPYSSVSRLFRRHPQIYFSRPYHAMIDDSVAQLWQQEPHWQIVELSTVAILHYGYQPGVITAQDKYAKARQAMEGFLATHPDDPYTCSKLGGLYLQMGQVEEAIALLTRGLTAQGDAPVLFELHYHLGNAYRTQDSNQAVQHYQRAIAQPILPRLKLGAYNNLGALLQAAGEGQAAQKIYQMALAIDPSFAVGYYNLGMTLKAQGRYSEAITAYRQAIRLEPHYGFAYQNLGVALFKLGQLPESQEAFTTAIRLHEAQNPPEAQRLRQGLQALGLSPATW